MDKIRNTISKFQLPIIVAGTGNVARSVIYAIQQTDINLLGVITRGNDDSIEYLNKIKTPVFNFNQPVKEPCLCILAVPDCYIESVAKSLNLNKDSILLHTAGSVGIDVLKSSPYRCGVLYPVQTFHKSKITDFKNINLCLEADSAETMIIIKQFAEKLKGKIHYIDSLQRLKLHISAVFACNFSNLMYSTAERILKENNIDFSLLHSLILETAHRATKFSPSTIQTGPAIRNDVTTLKKHIENIYGVDNEIYQLLTQAIIGKKFEY